MIILYVMEIPQNTGTKSTNPFPFNNLFLIKGYITGKNEWWMYLVGVIIALLGYTTFQYITLYPLISFARSNGVNINLSNLESVYNPDVIGMNRSLMLAVLGGMFIFTLLFLWIAIKFIQHKTFSSIITGFEKIRWKRYFFSFGIWGGLIIVFNIISYFISPQEFEIRFDPLKFLLLVITVIIFLPIQTATEEILFRGYLMQGFSVLFKNGIIPLILTSVLFGLMHASNPEVRAHGLLLMMPYFICFGAFLASLTLLDEGLELAMGIHCANNLISSLLVCSKNSVLQTDSIFYTSTENPGAEFISWIILASICFFILYKKYKLSNWKLLIR